MQPKHREPAGIAKTPPRKSTPRKSTRTKPDDVLIASADSFPASDPPGWISSKAHPVPPAPPNPRRKKPDK